MIILHEGDLFSVFSTEHRTPGNKRGSMQTKMRNLRTGAIIDYRFRAEDFVEKAVVEEIEHQYLYNDAAGYHFMNLENYEQLTLSKEVLGDATDYLIADGNVNIEFYDGKAIGVALPDTVDLKVVATEPGLQKATASSVMKPATLETGLVVQVPPFIEAGEKIKVKTDDGAYIERA
jgi:elongation factor P